MKKGKTIVIYPHEKGTICVARISNGAEHWLAITPQGDYRAWVGCFSYLGGRK